MQVHEQCHKVPGLQVPYSAQACMRPVVCRCRCHLPLHFIAAHFRQRTLPGPAPSHPHGDAYEDAHEDVHADSQEDAHEHAVKICMKSHTPMHMKVSIRMQMKTHGDVHEDSHEHACEDARVYAQHTSILDMTPSHCTTGLSPCCSATCCATATIYDPQTYYL